MSTFRGRRLRRDHQVELQVLPLTTPRRRRRHSVAAPAGPARRLPQELRGPSLDVRYESEWPIPPGMLLPAEPVVYVLFDRAGTPCYVGSSIDLRTQLRAHHAEGKRFAWWRCQPQADEATAREVETQWLQTFKPYLNRKATA